MQTAKILLLIILTSALVFILLKVTPNSSPDYGSDWEYTYRPAALAMVQGKSPYSVERFFAAPWSVIPLIPFALLPEPFGKTGVLLLGFLTFVYIAYKLGAPRASIIIFLLSASVIGCLWWGNIEWMPLLGVVLPAPIGLIFAITKPQVGIGIVIYWFIYTLRTKGLWNVIKTFMPVTVLTLLSFWIYGLWPLRFQQTLALSIRGKQYNTSLWPQGIFIGVWLLYKAIQSNQPKIAVTSSPFLSPYALPFTWVSVLVGLFDTPWELLIVSIALWASAVVL